MSQTILISALIMAILRVFPAFFAIASKIDNFPRFAKFLDYLICLITGEIIYSVAFADIEDYRTQSTLVIIIITTIAITAISMYKTKKLSQSLATALMYFIITYYIFIGI